MTTNSDLCHHPEDTQACRRLLVKAKRDGTIDQHCILDGLQEGRDQCRRVLLEGLAKHESCDTTASVSPSAETIAPPELRQACEEVLLCGYPLGIKAIPEIFHEAYWKYVRSIIRKRLGSNKRKQSYQDDISQTTFKQLHERLQKGGETIACLKGYVAVVAGNTCSNPGFGSKEARLEDEDVLGDDRNSSPELVPPSVIHTWEDFDDQMKHSNRDILNRFILAYMCVTGWANPKLIRPKPLIACWEPLMQMSESDVSCLMEKVIRETGRLRIEKLAEKVAHCVNSGLVKPYQIAVAFAAGMEMSLSQTRDLINELMDLVPDRVADRTSRIRRTLRESGETEKS
jgi:hypothetical protein